MSATRILQTIGVILGALILVLVLFLWFWDFSRYKPDIEAAVSEATGREFRIDGDFQVEVLPSPSVLIEGASLANAAWADEAEMLEVGHAYVRVGFWSLLFRPVVVHEFELSDVNLLLEANADGATNWEMAGQAEPEAEEDEDGDGPESPVDLRSANIENVTLTYRHPDAEDLVVALDSFVVTTDDDAGKRLEASGRWSDLPIGLRGSFADRASELEAEFGDVKFQSATTMPDESLDFTAALGSLEDVGKLLDIGNLPVEDLTVAGNLAMRGDTLVFSNIVAAVSGLELTLDGELDGAERSGTLTIGAGGESLAYLDAGLPDIPFAAKAELLLAPQRVELQPFALSFGDSRLSGTATVAGGDSTAIQLNAQSELIDLSPFAADEEQGEEAAGDAGEADDRQYVFNDEALPLAALAELDADMRLAVTVLKMQNAQFKNLQFSATASDGVLAVNTVFDGEHGGDYSNEVTLSTSGESADLEIATTVRDLKLGMLSGSEVPPEQIPATSLDVALRAAGATPRALASSADGRIVVRQGPGRVKNELIEKLSGDIIAQLFNALNPFAKDEEFSDWECTVLALDFDSGLGEITGFLLQSDKLMVVGGGEIDLNTEKLNIEFNTKPRAGVGISADMFVTPFVKLTGTLANPSVGLNAKGALLSGGAALLTGGMSFLYQGLVDRATAEGGRCEEALESLAAPPDSAGD